jgi:branched-chain amino acid transport system substrate-binding protein
VQSFVKKYKDKFGVEPDDHAAPYYDAVKILGQIMGKVGPDREKIAAELRGLKGYAGVQGDYSADKWGNLVHRVSLAKYSGGKWVWIADVGNLTDSN